MSDALLVGGVECVQDLARTFDGLVSGHGTSEGNAIHKFHHEVVRANIIEVADVGMIQGRNRARLAAEAVGEIRLREFDGDTPVETGVHRLPNFAHTTSPDTGQEFIRTETLAGGWRHRSHPLYRRKALLSSRRERTWSPGPSTGAL